KTEQEAERAIYDRLHEQETADSLASFIDELGGGGDAPVPDESDHPVAKFLTLLKHEDHEDDRQGELAQVFHQGGKKACDSLEPERALGLEDHRSGTLIRLLWRGWLGAGRRF